MPQMFPSSSLMVFFLIVISLLLFVCNFSQIFKSIYLASSTKMSTKKKEKICLFKW